MTKYCFDTSALLQPYVVVYPPAVFSTLWEKVDDAIEAGLIVAPDAVLDELAKKDDDLSKWAKDRPDIFIPLEEDIQQLTTEILTSHERLVETGKMRTEADPFVIALARRDGLTVVTEEVPQPSRKKVRIPEVCNDYEIPVTNFIGFVHEMGWGF